MEICAVGPEQSEYTNINILIYKYANIQIYKYTKKICVSLPGTV